MIGETDWIAALGTVRFASIPVEVFLFSGTALVAYLLLRFTKYGRYVYLMGDNFMAARNLGIPVRPLESIEEVVRNADIAIGGTTRTDIVSREPWVRPGATFVSLARREMDPAGWAQFDKVVIDDWDCNMTVREFRDMIDAGHFFGDPRYLLHDRVGALLRGAVG